MDGAAFRRHGYLATTLCIPESAPLGIVQPTSATSTTTIDTPAALRVAVSVKLAELKVVVRTITTCIIAPAGDVSVVQDVHATDESVSMLMPFQASACIDIFVGCYDVADFKTKKTIKMRRNECVFFRDKLVYSLPTSAAYVHCACSMLPSASSICVPAAIRMYACPFKKKLDANEVRGESTRFFIHDDGDGLGCTYSAKRWKNVLDHLDNCRHNPDTERRKHKQAKRKQSKLVDVTCEICGHRFRNKNSYVKHKSRKHPLHHAPSTNPDLNALLGIVSTNFEIPVASPVDTWSVAETGDISSLLEFIEAPEEEARPAEPARMKSDSKHVTKMQLESRLRRRRKKLRLLDDDLPVFSFNDKDRIYDTVRDIFATVTKADVRQPAGKREYNASELSMSGVSRMLDALGFIKHDDVFLDVGAGVGNVVAQVALESNFRWCIGVEMRSELVSLFNTLISCRNEERLEHVIALDVDITKHSLEIIHPVTETTHLFCHNTLFTEESKLALEELCWLPKLRCIAVSELLCPRHSARCKRPICHMWQVQQTVMVKVTYAHAPVALHILSRKNDDAFL